MPYPVDYVVTFVDSTDPNWQELYRKRMHGIDLPYVANRRYRNMDTIKYALRGVERHMPWINKIILIVQSESQLPKWLNRNYEKLRIIYHDEYIPKEYLPTFNSNVIEMFINKIPGLSENFILANDDMIPVKPIGLENYFVNGIPVFKKIIQSRNYHLKNKSIFKNILFNNTSLAMKYLNSEERIQLRHFHLLIPYRLSFWNKVFTELEPEILSSLKNSPMRTIRNVNHWLISDLQMLCEGESIDNQELNTRGYFALKDTKLKNDIFTAVRKANVVCINDLINKEYSMIKNTIDVLETFLPGKSSVEL